MGTQRVILLRFFEIGGAKKNKNSEFSHPQHCQNCMHSEDSCMQLKSFKISQPSSTHTVRNSNVLKTWREENNQTAAKTCTLYSVQCVFFPTFVWPGTVRRRVFCCCCRICVRFLSPSKCPKIYVHQFTWQIPTFFFLFQVHVRQVGGRGRCDSSSCGFAAGSSGSVCSGGQRRPGGRQDVGSSSP